MKSWFSHLTQLSSSVVGFHIFQEGMEFRDWQVRGADEAASKTTFKDKQKNWGGYIWCLTNWIHSPSFFLAVRPIAGCSCHLWGLLWVSPECPGGPEVWGEARHQDPPGAQPGAAQSRSSHSPPPPPQSKPEIRSTYQFQLSHEELFCECIK